MTPITRKKNIQKKMRVKPDMYKTKLEDGRIHGKNDEIPLSNCQTQVSGQCKRSTDGPLRQGLYSISHCTPPSLKMKSTI